MEISVSSCMVNHVSEEQYSSCVCNGGTPSLYQIADLELENPASGEILTLWQPEEHDVVTCPADSRSTGILMSTLWNLSGIVKIAGNQTITYNYYCPIDPSRNINSITGCTDTAAADILISNGAKVESSGDITIKALHL